MGHKFTNQQMMYMQKLLDQGLISDYYQFQRHYGRGYGALAANVPAGATASGKLAQNVLKAAIGEEAVQAKHGKLAAELARADLDLIRQFSGKIPEKRYIEEYHAKIFEKHGIPIEAFSGSLLASADIGWGLGNLTGEESAGGSSSAFDGMDRTKAAKLLAKGFGESLLNKPWDDDPQGGTRTKTGAVVNPNGMLGQTEYVDDSGPTDALGPPAKPRRKSHAEALYPDMRTEWPPEPPREVPDIVRTLYPSMLTEEERKPKPQKITAFDPVRLTKELEEIEAKQKIKPKRPFGSVL